MARSARRIEGLTPHPFPLPRGEGTMLQRLLPGALSQREKAGVRGSEHELAAAARNVSCVSCELEV